MAKVSAYAVGLERVQLDNIGSQIESLLDQCEAARRKFWEQKSERAEMALEETTRNKERYGRIMTTCSESSSVLCAAILDFCEAVGEDVQGERYATLVSRQR